MFEDLEISLNYLVRVGYNWNDLRTMPSYRVRRLCSLNAEIDNPKKTKDSGKEFDTTI